MPLIDGGIVEKLVTRYEEKPGIVVAQAKGRLQPLLGIYPKEALPLLLEELKDICLKRQSEKILLDERKSNEAAAGFYEKCGFTRDGIRKNYYREPTEDAVLMSFQFGK